MKFLRNVFLFLIAIIFLIGIIFFINYLQFNINPGTDISSRPEQTCTDRYYRGAYRDISNLPANPAIESDDIVLWRITFKIICGELIANKEIAFWRPHYESDNYQGLQFIHREIRPLQCTSQGQVKIESDNITLTGQGYVECRELESLNDVVNRLNNDIRFCDNPTRECQSFRGENVVISAEVKPSRSQTSTILDYSQPNAKHLRLELSRDSENAAQRLSFALSGKNVSSKAWYRADEHWLLLRAEQEPFLSSPFDNRFKFLIDGLRLDITDVTYDNYNYGNHYFSSEQSQTLIIGQGFIGEIREIIIDPSDTCLSCYPLSTFIIG